MLPRCLVVCTLLLAASAPAFAQSSPNVVHLGRNIVVSEAQRLHNASCFLCSADVEGRTTGNVRVFAGNAFLNGPVAGNVEVFGGNVTLTEKANIGGRLVIVGGHLHQDPATAAPTHTVLPPIIFLPFILIVFAIIGGLIAFTRRMVRDPMAYPPLPRL